MKDKLLQAANLANMIAMVAKSMELNPKKSPTNIQCVGVWADGVLKLLEECAGEELRERMHFKFKSEWAEKINSLAEHIMNIGVEAGHRVEAMAIASELYALFTGPVGVKNESV